MDGDVTNAWYDPEKQLARTRRDRDIYQKKTRTRGASLQQLTGYGDVEIERQAVLDLLRQKGGDVAQVINPTLRQDVLVILLVTHQLWTRRLPGNGRPDLRPLLLGVLGRHEAHVALLQVRVFEAEEGLHGLEVAVGELHEDPSHLAVAGGDHPAAHLLPVHDGRRPGHELQKGQQGQDRGHLTP